MKLFNKITKREGQEFDNKTWISFGSTCDASTAIPTGWYIRVILPYRVFRDYTDWESFCKKYDFCYPQFIFRRRKQQMFKHWSWIPAYKIGKLND